MKTKIILLSLFTFLLTTSKIAAQTNVEEAIATFQLAQDEFTRLQYAKALVYLDKVEKLNPDAKVKTSYLKAKCYKEELQKNRDRVNNRSVKMYNECMACIGYYNSNGKDEEKKAELLKIKITLENTKLGDLIKKFEGMSTNDAYNLIVEAMNKYPMRPQSFAQPWNKVWMDKCIFCITTSGWEGDYGDVSFISINLGDAYIPEGGKELKTNNENSFVNVSDLYPDIKKYNKYRVIDMDNYLKGINKTHSFNGHFFKNPFSKSDHGFDFYYIIGELNEEKQNDVTMAFIALIKNCGGGMK